ncbi:MAG: hypothetical protein AAGF31_07015 [Planctomycetota bacterium]
MCCLLALADARDRCTMHGRLGYAREGQGEGLACPSFLVPGAYVQASGG